MFEVRDLDLSARIGKIRTNHGAIETPAFLPVIHPVKQSIHPELIKKMGFDAVMTNSYITLKRYGDTAIERGIHSIIDFDGAVMTDSGGYQVLEYGDVDTNPLEVANFQESIKSDFAIILDRPTGVKSNWDDAEQSVIKTLESCKLTLDNLEERHSIWIGPVQGGRHLDLVNLSARKVSEMDFDMFALGSPTEVMERYDFALLAEMIIAAKSSLPVEKPFHLFGLGHPLPLSLAVALGCDTFDSASYMLYARNNRYMTENGTKRIDDLEYLPCTCRMCSLHSIEDIRTMEPDEKETTIAMHNLYMLKKEVEATKQAIREGRLWEYVGVRARAHPNLWAAFEIMAKNSSLFESYTPSFKSKGLMLFSYPDNLRPEITRYSNRIIEYLNSIRDRPLLIIPEGYTKPFLSSSLFDKSIKELIDSQPITIGYISMGLGFVPGELSDIYPLSQIVATKSLESDPRIVDDTMIKLKRQMDALAPTKRFLVEDRRLDDGVRSLLRNVVNPYLTFSLKSGRELSDHLVTIKASL